MIDALVLNADGSGLATLGDDGHGAVYFIGYGIGSPAAVNEPGWTTEKGVCVPESAPGIYTMTAQAGLEGSTTLGQRFRVSGWSGKFFRYGNLHAGAGRRGVLLDRRGRQHRNRLGSYSRGGCDLLPDTRRDGRK